MIPRLSTLVFGIAVALIGILLLAVGLFFWESLGLDGDQSTMLILAGTVPLLFGAWILDQRRRFIRHDVKKILTVLDKDKAQP